MRSATIKPDQDVSRCDGTHDSVRAIQFLITDNDECWHSTQFAYGAAYLRGWQETGRPPIFSSVEDFSYMYMRAGSFGNFMRYLEELGHEPLTDADCDKLFSDISHDAIRNSPKAPGIDILLHHLSVKNVPVGVVTNASESLYRVSAEATGLNKIARVVVSPNTAGVKRKPDPSMINHALGALEIRHRGTVIAIGDSVSDVVAYQKSGIDWIIGMVGTYPWSLRAQHAMTLRKAGARMVIDDMSIVPAIMQRHAIEMINKGMCYEA